MNFKFQKVGMQKIGLGTAAIGRPQYINIRNEKPIEFDLENFKKNGYKILDSAFEQGIRYFDTAPGYGLAEQLLIDWVKSKNDDSIEIATKWGYAYVANFDHQASVHEVKDHSLSQLLKQWEVSKQLFPHLSTLQIHSATFDTGILENQEVLEKLAELKNTHNILIGLTSTGDNQVDVLTKALDIKVNGKNLFEIFQVTYNILDQSLLAILDLIKKNNGRIVIKEALANGRIFPNEKYPHYQKMYSSLEYLSKKYAVGIDAIALQFCYQTINPFIILSGASTNNQLEQNLKTNHFELLEEEITLLKSFNINPINYWAERKKLAWN